MRWVPLVLLVVSGGCRSGSGDIQVNGLPPFGEVQSALWTAGWEFDAYTLALPSGALTGPVRVKPADLDVVSYSRSCRDYQDNLVGSAERSSELLDRLESGESACAIATELHDGHLNRPSPRRFLQVSLYLPWAPEGEVARPTEDRYNTPADGRASLGYRGGGEGWDASACELHSGAADSDWFLDPGVIEVLSATKNALHVQLDGELTDHTGESPDAELKAEIRATRCPPPNEPMTLLLVGPDAE